MFIGGLDLGQVGDFAALVIIQRHEAAGGAVYQVRHLHRWALGDSYPKILADVHALWERPMLRDSILCVDRTGVGRPIVDLFIHRGEIPIRAITITSGSVATEVDYGHNVPKKDLVGVLQVLFQQRRLHVAGELPLAELLVKELQNFRVKITAAANEIFESWRSGMNDDLVLATALPCWLAERGHLGAWDATPTNGDGRSVIADAPEGVFGTADEGGATTLWRAGR